MRQTILLLLTVLLSSCSENPNKSSKSVKDLVTEGNLETLKSKKELLSREMLKIQGYLQEINLALKTLDTVMSNAPLISVFQAKDTIFEHFIQVTGVTKSRQEVELRSEYNGVLIKINHISGSYVKKGTILAHIESGGLEHQLEQLRAKYELSKTIYERRSRLWDKKIGSEVEYLQSKTVYISDRRAYKQLQDQVAKTVIKAPFSGVVDDVMVDVGDFLTVGTPAIRLINNDKVYIESLLPETYLGLVKEGAKAIVYFPILKKKITTTVRQVGSFIYTGNRSFKVEIELPKKIKKATSNLMVKVKINDYTNPKAILIPKDIISDDGQGNKRVFFVENLKNNTGFAKQLLVDLGKSSGNLIEVISEIPDYTNLIKEGAKNVKDQQKVKIIDDK